MKSFQFSYCTIFSIVSLILFLFCCGSSCMWSCMKFVTSSVRKWYLEEMCVYTGWQLLHAAMPSGQLCVWASPASHVLVWVRRLWSAALTSFLGRDLAQHGFRWAELLVPFPVSLSCFIYLPLAWPLQTHSSRVSQRFCMVIKDKIYCKQSKN